LLGLVKANCVFFTNHGPSKYLRSGNIELIDTVIKVKIKNNRLKKYTKLS